MAFLAVLVPRVIEARPLFNNHDTPDWMDPCGAGIRDVPDPDYDSIAHIKQMILTIGDSLPTLNHLKHFPDDAERWLVSGHREKYDFLPKFGLEKVELDWHRDLQTFVAAYQVLVKNQDAKENLKSIKAHVRATLCTMENDFGINWTLNVVNMKEMGKKLKDFEWDEVTETTKLLDRLFTFEKLKRYLQDLKEHLETKKHYRQKE